MCGGTQLEIYEELGITQRVSSTGLVSGSKMMVMKRDDTKKVTFEFQHQIRTSIWKLFRKETDGAQHHTCIVGSLYPLVR
ncbi:hypothetical protein TNCV_3529301 [Trichonephila clavipes]|uniref:Uncharacterized protein n=1 Tax=Trichonephila clavipes TaxID=2585209 RepID=A0A8X6RHH4_TRICX|nr:hypothetical protein TNCV_3529301 [Trichonephila clavipes]